MGACRIEELHHGVCGGPVELVADRDRVEDRYEPTANEQRATRHMWMLTTNCQTEEL